MSAPGYSPGSYFNGINGIHLGDDVWIGPGVKVISGNHDRAAMQLHLSAKPIRIGNKVWIGANAIILPGVTVGDGATVGAGAVVIRDVPPGALVVGNPARIVEKKDMLDA